MPLAIYASLTRFDRARDPHDHVSDPVLPADPGVSHAFLVPSPGEFRGDPRRRSFFSASAESIHQTLQKTREPQFLEGPVYYKPAACGRTLKVILPTAFNEDDPDACQSCVAALYRRDEELRLLDSEDEPPPV